MPSKTTVITGATSGIGKETAKALAHDGYTLYLLVRNVKKGEKLKEELSAETGNKDIHLIHCDVSDMHSVQDAVEELKSKLSSINILINNAGSAFTKRYTSGDGFEMTFALNHLGHFLLTTGLLPLLIAGKARVINVASEGHKSARPDFDNLQMEHGYTAFKAYALSKLYNIYFTKSLAEKYGEDGITSYAVHPGVVATNIWNKVEGFAKVLLLVLKIFMVSPAKGAETNIYLATASNEELKGKSGLYFKKKKVAETSAAAGDENARNTLWNISEHLVNQTKR